MKKFVESGQLGIFQNAYWGHPAYKLPPEANLMAVAHYLEALKWQKEIIKIHTIFGGKNPHPNYLVGGMASAIALQSDNAINMERLNMVRDLIKDAIGIVEDLYIPDLLAVASFYPEWTTIGGGLGNYMVYGDMPQNGIGDTSQLPLPARHHPEQEPGRSAAARSWPTRTRSRRRSRTPGTTTPMARTRCIPGRASPRPSYTGPKPPYKNLDENAKVLLAESAALEGPRHGSRTAGAHAGRLRQRPHRIQRSGDRGARPSEAPCRRRCSRRSAARPRAASKRSSASTG